MIGSARNLTVLTIDPGEVPILSILAHFWAMSPVLGHCAVLEKKQAERALVAYALPEDKVLASPSEYQCKITT